jgi:hypothetical protein
MAGAIYLPQYDPYAGLREGLMALAMGYTNKVQRNNQLDQMKSLMGAINPNEQGMIDLSGIMNSVKDPSMIQGIMPYVLENNMGIQKAQAAAKAEAAKPVKMTLWKNGKAQELMVPQDQWNDVANKAEAQGYSVSEKEPAKPAMEVGKQVTYSQDIGGKTMDVTYNVIGHDANGIPILDVAKDAKGKPIMGEKRQQKIEINMPKAAPEGERKQLADLLSLQGTVQRLEDMYDPSYVGLIQGPIGTVQSKVGFGISEKELQFRQLTSDIQDTLLRARSGAQINEQEYKRLSKIVPVYTDSNKNFTAKLKAFKKTLAETIKQKQYNLQQSGFIPPTKAGGAPSPSGQRFQIIEVK